MIMSKKELLIREKSIIKENWEGLEVIQVLTPSWFMQKRLKKAKYKESLSDLKEDLEIEEP